MLLVSKKQDVIRIKTPAKITPHLRVGAKRGDGFHEVRIVLVPISLLDTLEFRRRPRGGLSLAVDSLDDLGAKEENLVCRAAVAFAEATGTGLDLDIDLKKKIPAGAGLGGGSGNAAGTLLALNAMNGQPLSKPRLFELALGLGSDVPFFLMGAPALAEGRGEKLSALPPFPALPLIVVKPPFSISTAEAYQGCRRSGLEGEPPRAANPAELRDALGNDFEAGLFDAHAELPATKARLLELGAQGALLSGSGSALFGWYPSPEARDEALQKLECGEGWRVLPCETLPAHTYLPETPAP